MGLVGEIVVFLGPCGTLGLAIASFIGVWGLTVGRELCKRQWKFIYSAVMMPGPKAIPIIGNVLYFARTGDELLEKIVTLCQKYERPFRFWFGPKLFVILRDPRDIAVIMNSPVATYKPSEYRFLATYLGPGLVSNSGPTHKAHRKLIMPMVNGKILNTFLDCFDKHSRRCVKCLEERIDTGEFDIIHYMDDCTLDIILETIMGAPGTAQNNGYRGIIDCCSRAIGLAYERGIKAWLYPDWIYSRTKAGQDFSHDMKILHNFTDTFVARKKEEYYASEDGFDFTNKPLIAVLDRLMDYNEKTKLMTDEELSHEMANVWKPAQDPTALTSSFLFMMLGMHPDVQEKVRAEVREVVGDEDITLEQVSKLKYLEMVFKETVRLFPVGPLILRGPQDDVEFETCTAPKDCTIVMFVYMTHRDPRHWVEPEKFNPERFTPENSAGRHPYAFVPFSSGARGCIGRHYATMLMRVLVARVIQKYRIHSKGSMETLRLKTGVSIRSVDGYKVSITRI